MSPCSQACPDFASPVHPEVPISISLGAVVMCFQGFCTDRGHSTCAMSWAAR